MDAFGATLDYFCEQQGITLQELANEISVSRNTLGNWKRRGRPPSQDDTLKLAKVLYLDENETNKLLIVAGYAPKYSIKDNIVTSLPQIETLNVSRLVVERVEGPADSNKYPHSARCDWYAHISMPPNYIDRTELTKDVRNGLLTDSRTIALTSVVQHHKPNALHGMGGIGKSVIARALCDEPEVQVKFPDGILWVTLGQTPDLISKMREWVLTLGGTVTENIPTVDSMKVALAKLLKDRACLLILDDVWQATHLEAFRFGGPRCRFLLTTRDAEIARKFGAKIQPVPVMTENEAVMLLEEWADGQLSQVDLRLKEQIVKRLGYLPLAVKLAGAQLWRKPASVWLHTFAAHRLKAQREDPSNIHDSLERTFNISLEELTEKDYHLYVALAIFKEDELIPQAGIERLWQGLGGLNVAETIDLLDDLMARALLEVTSSTREVRLHDLLRDFIAEKLKEGHNEAHQALLNAYRTKWRGIGWHTADNDGYLYDHLAYHLNAVVAIDELKGLFANQQWLQMRVPQRDYTYDGYLSDLALAWKCADSEARQQIQTNQEPFAFSDCLRYLLIHASINSIAGNYIPELVAQALKIGLWSSHRALSLAAKIPDESERAEMYVAILKTATLNEEEQSDAQRTGLEAALVIRDEQGRARVLAALAPQLTGEMLQPAMEAALVIRDEQGRARVLAALAPQLTGEKQVEVLAHGLEATLKIRDEDKGVEVLAALAPQLTEEMLQRALEAALTIEDEDERVEVLAALAPHLSEEMFQCALEAALEIWDKDERTRVLAALAPQLTEEMLQRTLKGALKIWNEWKRARVLAVLAPQLTGEMLQRVLEAAFAMEDEEYRARVLTALAPQLTGEMLQRALEVAFAMEDEEYRARVLTALAPQLAGEMLQRALEAAFAMEVEEYRAEVLAALAPQLTEEMLQRPLEAALAIRDEEYRAEVLAVLAPQLAGEKQVEVLAHGLEAAFTIEDEWKRAEVLAALVPHLKGETVQRGLEVTLAIRDEEYRAEVLAALAPQLTGEMLQRGLEAAFTIEDEEYRARVLTALAPQLTEEMFQRVLEAAFTIQNEWKRAEVLEALAPHITEEMLQRGLEAAFAMEDEEYRAEVLAVLAPQLTGEKQIEVLAHGLEAALKIGDEDKRVGVLEALVPYLKGEMLQRVLEAALKIQFEGYRVYILVALAPQLKGEMLQRVLEAAFAMEDEEYRARVLAVLAPQLTGEKQVEVLAHGLEAALKIRYEWKRAGVLEALVPYLKGEMLQRVLEAAFTIQGEGYRVSVLAALAPHLTGEMLQRVLEVAFTIEDEWKRAEVLAALAPQLTGEMLQRALEVVFTIRDRHGRVRMPTVILHSETNQGRLLQSIRKVMLDYAFSMRYWSRGEVLASFFDQEIFAPPIFSPEILRTIASSIVEICKEWNWL